MGVGGVIFDQTGSFQLQVRLSMFELLLSLHIKDLTCYKLLSKPFFILLIVDGNKQLYVLKQTYSFRCRSI